MYKHLALVVVLLTVLSSGKILADPAAKPTDPQIAHIAYTADLLDVQAGKQALTNLRTRMYAPSRNE
jgi:putative membrane protein